MSTIAVERVTCTRIPTQWGEFQLCYYSNNRDDEEHLALVVGAPPLAGDVLVRVHSECFTGDVLGSLRCDCGPQLQRAMELIAAEGEGVLIYLRQEGRGIGLLDKLRAYNLQDEGYDTVDANLMLGHQADAREYSIAALILEDLGVQHVRLLTNNPTKIESLRRLGIDVRSRVPLEIGANVENVGYLQTKVERMRHLLDLQLLRKISAGSATAAGREADSAAPRPRVTLSYAQSLDGSITDERGKTLAISGQESLMMTHRLRATHDAVLIGIGTVLADDPQLTVRLVEGEDPQPVVVDSLSRFPLEARLLQGDKKPWIATTAGADDERRQALEAAGARVLALPADQEGRVRLDALLARLTELGVESLMVEGGAEIIGSFLQEGLVDRLVVTVAPMLVAGLPALEPLFQETRLRLPKLRHARYEQLGDDFVLFADVEWQPVSS